MKSELTDELLARARQTPDRTGNACGAWCCASQGAVA